MDNNLFVMPELDMYEYEVDEIMSATNPNFDVNSEIKMVEKISYNN